MKLYFPGLNALRFFAASFVIMGHTEQVKQWMGMDARIGVLNRLSGLSVTFFFVLSGFLITSLLLQEKRNTGTINVRNFYIRRILRIWPLYFAVVIIAYMVMPWLPGFSLSDNSVYRDAPDNIGLHLLLWPNAALVLGLAIPYASQLWSIGVEEQFYAVWPLCMKAVKRYEPMLILIIAIFVVSRNLASHLGLKDVHYFLNLTRIDCMAVGGLFAYYVFKKKHHALVSEPVKWITIALIVSFVIAGVAVPYIDNVVYSCLFALLILNISLTGKPTILETPLMRSLGDLSYGMYMLHLFAIGLVLIFASHLNTIMIHILTQCVTILMAYLSYRYFETPFLLTKDKFAVIENLKHYEPTFKTSGAGNAYAK
jgi:peptidoglycan/LPS O-acetylase OafA/YrhL